MTVNYDTVKEKILECIGTDKYDKFHERIILYLPICQKIRILYECIRIEDEIPDITKFIEEFIKTISPDELNERMIFKLIHYKNKTVYEELGGTLLEHLVDWYDELNFQKNIKLIVDAGAKVNIIKNDTIGMASTSDDRTLLWDFIKNFLGDFGEKEYNLIKTLLDNGADVNKAFMKENQPTIFESLIIYHIKNIKIIRSKYEFFNDDDAYLLELLLEYGAKNELKKSIRDKFTKKVNSINNLARFILPQTKTKRALK